MPGSQDFMVNQNNVKSKLKWLTDRVKCLYAEYEAGRNFIGAKEINIDSQNDNYASAEKKATIALNNMETFCLDGSYLPIIKLQYRDLYYSLTFAIKAVGYFGMEGEQIKPSDLIVISRFNPGVKNTALDTFTHVQYTLSSVWTVNHNMDKKPSVVVLDTLGQRVLTEIDYVDNNTLKSITNLPLKGRLICN